MLWSRHRDSFRRCYLHLKWHFCTSNLLRFRKSWRTLGWATGWLMQLWTMRWRGRWKFGSLIPFSGSHLILSRKIFPFKKTKTFLHGWRIAIPHSGSGLSWMGPLLRRQLWSLAIQSLLLGRRGQVVPKNQNLCSQCTIGLMATSWMNTSCPNKYFCLIKRLLLQKSQLILRIVNFWGKTFFCVKLLPKLNLRPPSSILICAKSCTLEFGNKGVQKHGRDKFLWKEGVKNYPPNPIF